MIQKSVLLIAVGVAVLCGVYPAAVWVVGRIFFPFQAGGSLLKGPDGKVVGSKLIAQPFTRDEYFQPRPSAASYDASASSSSALAVSNYALRDRVARMIGPIVKYRSGPKAGQAAAPDIEAWFQQDRYQGNPGIVAQWADLHNGLAAAWVSTDQAHVACVGEWLKLHPAVVAEWIKNNPGAAHPGAVDIAVPFFETFSKENPGRFPSVKNAGSGAGPTLEPVQDGPEIQSVFFDMWRNDHPGADLEQIPGDLVTTSASGLDPDITLENAEYQLERVASKWAADLNRDPAQVHAEIEQVLEANAKAPFHGLAGDRLVNVLEINLELRKRYGPPK